MLIPEKLKNGDTIVVVSPSSSISEKDKEYIDESKKMLEFVRIKRRI